MSSVFRSRSARTVGISVLAFIIAVAVSIAYYQYFYIPQLNRKPAVPGNILKPPSSLSVQIIKGSSNPNQKDNLVPSEIKGVLGQNNEIIWTNNDEVPHSVTSDNGYMDRVNGKFDSLATVGLIMPGNSFNFTFTEPGEYPYHCEPHPWMRGKVTIAQQ